MQGVTRLLQIWEFFYLLILSKRSNENGRGSKFSGLLWYTIPKRMLLLKNRWSSNGNLFELSKYEMYCETSFLSKIWVTQILRWFSWFMALLSLYLDLLASFISTARHASCWVWCALVHCCCWILKWWNLVHSSATCHNRWADSSSGSMFSLSYLLS